MNFAKVNGFIPAAPITEEAKVTFPEISLEHSQKIRLSAKLKHIESVPSVNLQAPNHFWSQCPKILLNEKILDIAVSEELTVTEACHIITSGIPLHVTLDKKKNFYHIVAQFECPEMIQSVSDS